MILSNACEYSLRATIYLAALDDDRYVPIREISGKLGISFQFLTKVFQQLTRAGLMTSYRGPTGGVKLTASPAEVSVLDIVLAVDGPGLFRECILGLPGCGARVPCPLHNNWSVERERLRTLFSETSLKDVAEGLSLSGLLSRVSAAPSGKGD